MKARLLLSLLLLAIAFVRLGGAEPARTVVLEGTVTNTTADVAAKARLVLTITGEKVSAMLTTEQPLMGRGRIEGTMQGGWCELAGKLEEGFQIQFRGVLNAVDYRGTYLAAVPQTPVQYGSFQLKITPP
jgi:hypothetical protein